MLRCRVAPLVLPVLGRLFKGEVRNLRGSDSSRRAAIFCNRQRRCLERGINFAMLRCRVAPLVHPVLGRLFKGQNMQNRQVDLPFLSQACALQINLRQARNKKATQRVALLFCPLAEREGFEPPEPRSSTVFKTAAIDHSAIFPMQMYNLNSIYPKISISFL